jgi:lantibiotic modifying enzyme
MEKQSIYLGWRFYRDINTESVIRELVYISSDWDNMVKTLESEFNLNGREFVELNENAELMSEKFGYYGSIFIEEQVVDAFWNGYTSIVK